MGIMKNKNLPFLYLYLGLAFLFWENLVGSLLGIHGIELRRILWGIVYYCLLFLVILLFIIPGFRWYSGRCQLPL